MIILAKLVLLNQLLCYNDTIPLLFFPSLFSSLSPYLFPGFHSFYRIHYEANVRFSLGEEYVREESKK